MIKIKQTLSSGNRIMGITLDSEAEAQAELFHAAGGWLEAETIASGRVIFTACTTSGDLAIQTCNNGPEVKDAVRSLIMQSMEHLRVYE